MNTSLKIIALALASVLPGTIALELCGFAVPTMMDPLHVFAALVASLTLLLVFSDYQNRGTLRILVQQAAIASPQRTAAHPLAA